MKNYIRICGQEIELTEEQVEQLRAGLGASGTMLASLEVKSTCKIGGHELIVMEQLDGNTLLLRKESLRESRFGDNNNYDGSDADSACNEFANEIAAIIGAENIVEHTVDLTSDDGLKDCGKIKRKASLLTAELYRRYVYILDKSKLKKWWWLATPWSTPAHEDSTCVKCVSPVGGIYYFNCFGDIGVRPILYFVSSIFGSCEG